MRRSVPLILTVIEVRGTPGLPGPAVEAVSAAARLSCPLSVRDAAATLAPRTESRAISIKENYCEKDPAGGLHHWTRHGCPSCPDEERSERHPSDTRHRRAGTRLSPLLRPALSIEAVSGGMIVTWIRES